MHPNKNKFPRKHIKAGFTVALALLAASLHGEGLLWRATKGGAEIYLLGTIHILSADFYPLPAKIEEVARQADVLTLEVDISAQDMDAQIVGLFQENGFYTDGSTLADHLPPQSFEQTSALLQEYGLVDPSFLVMKPWLLALILQQIILSRHGYDAVHGIEMTLIGIHGDKEIRELEDATFQVKLMADLSAEHQVQLLEDTLREAEKTTEMLETAIQAWKSGDVDTIEELLLEGELDEAITQFLIIDRNQLMAERINAMAEDLDALMLVAVGAGHMVGDQGIPFLLSEMGFEVSRVQADETP